MICQQVRELLPLYADGDLERADRDAVTRHLSDCPECRKCLALDRRLGGALSALGEEAAIAHAPANLRTRVIDATRGESRSILRGALLLSRAAAFAVLVLVAASLAYALSALVPASVGPQPGPTMPGNSPLTVLGDEKLVDPYYWPVEGDLIDRTPQLSPDGSKVAYLPTVDGKASDIDRIVVRDLASGTERDLTPEEGYSYSIVRWSPDGRSLAFVKSRSGQSSGAASELWRVDASGGNLRLLYRPLPPASSARGPSFTISRWSSDGRIIELAPAIWNVGPEGVPVRFISALGGGEVTALVPTVGWFGVPQDALVGSTVYSPAGDLALQVVKTAPLVERPLGADPNGYSLVVYHVKEQKSRVLASFPGQISLSHADLAPDGQWISIRTTSQASVAPEVATDLWVVRHDGSGLRQVVDLPTDRQWGGFVWANGGRAFLNMTPQIWVSRPDGQLYEIDAVSGSARFLAPETWPASVLAASRDGSKLLVGRRAGEHGSLHLLRLGPSPVIPVPVTSPSPSRVPPTSAPPTPVPSPLALEEGTRIAMMPEGSGWLWDDTRLLRSTDGGKTWTDVKPKVPGAPPAGVTGRSRFSSTYFLDGKTAWAWAAEDDGATGTLFRTVDGGFSWSTYPTSGRPGRLEFLDGQRGWALIALGAAAGSSPVELRRTVDGGAHWEVLSRAEPGEAEPSGAIPARGIKTGITFSDANRGWVTGSIPVNGKPYVYGTTDGGKTWAEVAFDLPAEFRTDAFVNAEPPAFFGESEGIFPMRVMAPNHTAMLFYRTRDGGRTWLGAPPVRLPLESTLLWSFADASRGVVAVTDKGGNTSLLRTVDGGQTWEQIPAPRGLTSPSQIQFLSGDDGYAIGTGTSGLELLWTTDGGRNWIGMGATERRAASPSAQSGAGTAPAVPIKPTTAVGRPPGVAAPDTVGTCDPASLQASATWQGATGAMAGWATLTNISSTACALPGRPLVALADASGATLAVKSAPNLDKPDPPGGMVILKPGETAGVMFVWRNWCGPEPALPLSVRVGGYATALAVDVTNQPLSVLPRCDVPEQRSTLSSGPFEPVN